jgi:hypothetical protein
LEDAKKKAYGALVEGTYALDLSKDGWRMTPKGIEWITKNKVRISEALKCKTPTLPKRDADRFARKLRTEPAFKHFTKTGGLDGVSSYMFTDMLGCAPDASSDIILQKFNRLLATAKLADDGDVIDFLEGCKSTFSNLL